MTAGMLAATVLAVFSSSAAAASYAWFDRPEAASANSHAAVSNDVYVRGFGWAWGNCSYPRTHRPVPPCQRQGGKRATSRSAARSCRGASKTRTGRRAIRAASSA